MLTSFKGRSIDLSKKVRVYRNLNNGLLSVTQSGLVVCHADAITLSDATFIVNEKGRQRVIKEGRKNVHAFIEGWFVPSSFKVKMECSVRYNPYQDSTFMFNWDNEPIHSAQYCTVYSSGKIFVKGAR